MIFDEVMVINPDRNRDMLERVESALMRVEAAAARLQQQHSTAQARYEMLDRAGTEILAAIDALTNDNVVQDLRPGAPDQPRAVRPSLPDHAETADAA